jgi:hypothetical protein
MNGGMPAFGDIAGLAGLLGKTGKTAGRAKGKGSLISRQASCSGFAFFTSKFRDHTLAALSNK